MNRLSVFAACALVLAAGVAGLDRLTAQGPPSDATLDVASGGRFIAVGAASGAGPVTVVPLERYVARVLAGEAEPSAPAAALQAHAVAIRTFAIANVDRHRREGFDLCDSTHCQVLRAATAATRSAAYATAGRVLTQDGTIAEVVYSASCGGRSESASEIWSGRSVPYLRSVPDDVHGDDVPWTLTLGLDEVRRLLQQSGFAGERLTDVVVEARTESGRVARLGVTGLRPPVVSGEQFRSAIGPNVLRSTAFSVERRGDRLTFTGRGFGHGVGLCVVGAGRRARRGETTEAILAHYYPGLEQTALDRVLPRGDSVAARTSPSPSSATATARGGVSRSTAVVVRVGPGAQMPAADLERVAVHAYDDLSTVLGLSVAPVSIDLHGSMEAFRAATNQPWWVSAAVRGSAIDLPPAELLAQRSGLESAVRTAVAEVLLATPLADRPAWVLAGAARHFARTTPRPPAGARVVCPSDAELRLAISAPAYRDAEARAEACFAAAYAKTRDWRSVR